MRDEENPEDGRCDLCDARVGNAHMDRVDACEGCRMGREIAALRARAEKAEGERDDLRAQMRAVAVKLDLQDAPDGPTTFSRLGLQHQRIIAIEGERDRLREELRGGMWEWNGSREFCRVCGVTPREHEHAASCHLAELLGEPRMPKALGSEPGGES